YAAIHLLIGLERQKAVHVDGVKIAPGALHRIGLADAGTAASKEKRLDRFKAFAHGACAIHADARARRERHHRATLGRRLDIVDTAMKQQPRDMIWLAAAATWRCVVALSRWMR